MDAETRNRAADLAAKLRAQPTQWTAMAAIAECAREVGLDRVRVIGVTDLGHPKAEIGAVTVGEEAGEPVLVVALTGFGLAGAMGALPSAYVDLIARGARDSAALRDWLAVIEAPIGALLFRAEVRQDLALAWDLRRTPGAGEKRTRRHDLAHNPAARILFALAGVDLAGIDEDHPLSSIDQRRVGRLPAWASRVRTAVGLAQVIGDLTGVACAVRECQGAWLTVPMQERTLLGRHHAGLGQGAIAGCHVFSADCGLDLVVGETLSGEVQALDYPTYDALLPIHEGGKAIARTAALHLNDAKILRLKLWLRGDHLPNSVFPEKTTTESHNFRLGYNLWLGLPSSNPPGAVSVTFRLP